MLNHLNANCQNKMCWTISVRARSFKLYQKFGGSGCPESQESITTFEMSLDTKNLDSSKFCFNANWPLTEGVVVD